MLLSRYRPSSSLLSSSGHRSHPRSFHASLLAPLETITELLSHPKNRIPIETPLRGQALLNSKRLNKGAAFTREERIEFGLEGLLPFEVHGLERQCERAYLQMLKRSDDLSKYTFLASLAGQNQVLFYTLALRHLKEILPIIYTPTVGKAIENYSTIWRRPDGLFLSTPDLKLMRDLMFAKKAPTDVDLIVVTDSEAILGIGDMGVGGILISVGKANIYSIGGGIDPSRILSVVLDVGTDNQQLLNDPLYLGWRHRRLRGAEYDEFVSRFCDIVRQDYPDCFLHFEDFGTANAGRLLQKYRPIQSVFNDDMQGTAAVVVAALTGACAVTKSQLKEQRIVIFGFGTAGLGIADGIRNTLMIEGGLTSEEARKCFWVIDRPGLLTTDHKNLRPGVENFLRDAQDVAHYKRDQDPEKGINLLEVIGQAHPTILIGCSTMPGAFSETVCREMAKHCERPVIFPLSNPTRLAECAPSEASQWTGGKALIATGSPFPPVELPSGKMYKIAESNNCLVYPGFGLGVIVSKASKLTDSMITAGVVALAKLAPALKDPDESLLPSLEDLRFVSLQIAVAVANAARSEGVSKVIRETDWTEDEMREEQWDPVYRPLKAVSVGDKK